MGDWFDSPGRPGRRRPRQRDVVLAPGPQHRLRPAGRAAARRRQQGADLRPALADPQPAAARCSTRAGRKGYVAERAPARAPSSDNQPETPPRHGRAGEDRRPGRARPAAGQVVFDFPVKLGRQPQDGSPDAGKNVFNGGLRVDITKLNAAGHLRRQRASRRSRSSASGCDDHPGIDPDGDGYITVAEDFNQSPGYAQAGLTAAVNRPLAKNRDGQEGRVAGAARERIPNLLDAGARMDVEFIQGPATASGDTERRARPARARLRRRQHRLPGRPQPLHRRTRAGASARSTRAGSARARSRWTASARSCSPTTRCRAGPYGARTADGATADACSQRAGCSGGGNLVLTDGALRALPEVTGVPADAVARAQAVRRPDRVRALRRDVRRSSEPLASAPNDVAPGGRALQLRQPPADCTSRRRWASRSRTPSPTRGDVGDDAAESPAWDVDAAAFAKAPAGGSLASAVEAGAVRQRPGVRPRRDGRDRARATGGCASSAR